MGLIDRRSLNWLRLRRTPILLTMAGALLLTTSGCAVWRIGQSAKLIRDSEPFQQRPSGASLRLLIVGDSTAVGTGASSPQNSLAGRIGRDHPRLWIENRSKDGAKFSDIAGQLDGDGQFDAVLVQGGGNDVIRMVGQEQLRGDVERVTALASRRARTVILMPAGNVGNSAFFFPPVSWLMTQRSRMLHNQVRDAAARHGAIYVNLFREAADDPFILNPSFTASDGLHPSDAGYDSWYAELRRQADLARRLERANAG